MSKEENEVQASRSQTMARLRDAAIRLPDETWILDRIRDLEAQWARS